MVEDLYPRLKDGQRTIVDRVISTVYSRDSPCQHHFFLEGARGIGKAQVYNLIRMVRLRRDGVVAVAFTGTDTTPLIGCSRVHNRFRLQLKVFRNSTSSTAANSLKRRW